MKKILFALFAVLFLASCSKSDYLNVVPANATFVASANLSSLAEKSNFSESSIAGMMEEYMGAVFSGDAKKQMKKYMESPKDMGVDFREPVYVFKTANQCVGMAMKMLDKGDFEDFIKMLQKQNIASKAVDRDGVMTGTFLDDIDYGYDGKTILLLSSLGEGGSAVGKRTLAQLFSQKSDDSFVETEAYEECFAGVEKDINIFSNIAALPQDVAIKIKSLIPNGVRMTDLQFLASVDFQNGKAVLSSQFVGTNDKARKMLKEGDKNFHKIEGRYINMPTKDFLAWGCMGVNGEWLLDKMKQDTETKQTLFLIERGIDIEAMIKAIDGDVAFTFPKSFYTSLDSKTTDFMVCGQLKNDDFLDDVDYWKEGMKEYGITMQKTGKNEYFLNAPDFKINWGVNDDDLFIGTQNAYQGMANGVKSDALKNYASDIKDCQVFFFVNLSALPLTELAMMSGVPALKNAAKQLKAIVFKVKSSSSMELSIDLNDDKQNFLKALL